MVDAWFAEDVKKQHQEERAGDFRDLIRDGDGYCLQPVTDARDSTLMHATCYSPPMQLKPGQVSRASSPASTHALTSQSHVRSGLQVLQPKPFEVLLMPHATYLCDAVGASATSRIILLQN